MEDIFEITQPLGPIDPVDLEQDHVEGREMVALLLLGIFNPMGPTLTALTLLRDDRAPVAYLLLTSLNPFSQTRQLVARAGDNLESVAAVMAQLGDSPSAPFMSTLPNLVLMPSQDDGVRDALMPVVWNLLSTVPLSQPLAETVAAYQQNPGKPWDRIPSFEAMMQKTSGGDGGSNEMAPTGAEDGTTFEEWIEVMTDSHHVTSEFMAIIQAWRGSIQNFAPGVPHMPIEEAAAELTAMGFPYFKKSS